MPIFYALVSRRQTVLAEYTARSGESLGAARAAPSAPPPHARPGPRPSRLPLSGNFPTVTRVLLGKVTDADQKMSYIYDK